jgi:hypothetical protein
VVHVPLTFAVRGGRKTIISAAPLPMHTPPRTRFDDSLIKALAKAHRWQKLIEDDTYGSITELAKEKRINQSYACRVLRLTLLAPDIIEAILNRRGSTLTLDGVMRPMPNNWDEQWRLLQLH